MAEPRHGTMELERAHYRFLGSLPGPEQWAIKYLYDRLNILDSKAGALMRSNGMIIGFLGAIVVGLLRDANVQTGVRGFALAGIIVIFALLARAEVLSFRIFGLQFDRVEDERDLARYLEVFFDVTMRRECELGRALTLSKMGTFGFILLFFGLAVFELYKTLCSY
jgi:hypothetical protein